LYRLDADETAAVTFVFKFDNAGDFCEKGVVSTDTDVHAGFEFGSALADEYGAAGHQLSSESFHAKPLGMTVPSVA